MGTNVYFLSKNKKATEQYFGRDDYCITDSPYFAYEIHVMKRSGGWLPLWQAHEKCKSVREYKDAYDSGFFEIYDENKVQYTWDEFWDQFGSYNGGKYGVMPRTKIVQDNSSKFYDSNLPEYGPISHFDYANGRYSSEYFKDEEEYEFSKSWFR